MHLHISMHNCMRVRPTPPSSFNRLELVHKKVVSRGWIQPLRLAGAGFGHVLFSPVSEWVGGTRAADRWPRLGGPTLGLGPRGKMRIRPSGPRKSPKKGRNPPMGKRGSSPQEPTNPSQNLPPRPQTHTHGDLLGPARVVPEGILQQNRA